MRTELKQGVSSTHALVESSSHMLTTTGPYSVGEDSCLVHPDVKIMSTAEHSEIEMANSVEGGLRICT